MTYVVPRAHKSIMTVDAEPVFCKCRQLLKASSSQGARDAMSGHLRGLGCSKVLAILGDLWCLVADAIIRIMSPNVFPYPS